MSEFTGKTLKNYELDALIGEEYGYLSSGQYQSTLDDSTILVDDFATNWLTQTTQSDRVLS